MWFVHVSEKAVSKYNVGFIILPRDLAQLIYLCHLLIENQNTYMPPID